MSPLSIVVILLLAVSSTVYGSIADLCIPANDSAAVSVIGQTEFTNGGAGVSLNNLDQPSSIVVNDVTQKVYVSDANNNRILRYNSTATLITNNTAAELVLFGGVAAACNETLSGPQQIDYVGDFLFIADTTQNRVLKISNIQNATVTINSTAAVIGQPNASTCTAGVGLKGLTSPSGVAVTANGTLYVAEVGDGVNCFIKRFDNTSVDYADVTSLLGNGSCFASDASFSNNPGYLGIDYVNGHLFAVDRTSNRVLLFKQAQLKANATGADVVFGQPDFITTTLGCSATGLNNPSGVFYDLDNNVLIVSDFNNRVVFYDNPLNASNGAPAAKVIGQQNLDNCTATGLFANTLNNPRGVSYTSDFPGVFLLVADLGANRILRFQCANNTFSLTETLSDTANGTSFTPSSIEASSLIGNSSIIANSSSGVVAASSSGVVAASSSGVVASSSGVIAASSSGVVAASSSGVVASSSGVAASSSGVVAASSSGVVPESSSGVVPSITATSSESQSNTPSVTDPLNTQTASPIQPVIPASSGVSVVPPVCGNGIVEAGEQCDAGSAVPRTKCCTPFCTNLRVRAPCGKATSKCTKRPKCGRSPTSRQLVCNPGVPKKVGKKCGKGGIFSRKTCKADGTCSKN